MNYSVSVVTPAYNAGPFISSMIESILVQPVIPELVIVNDGSTDKTGEICSRYAALNRNIKYIETINMGAGHARNVGMQNAEGNYIIFLDSDDLMLADTLNNDFEEYLHDCAKLKIDIVYTAKAQTDINLQRKPMVLLPEAISEIRNGIPLLEFCTGIYRREFLVSKKINFFEYRKQDIETAFRFRAFSSAENIIVAPEILFYLQRDNPDSVSHTWNYYNLYSVKAKVYLELAGEEENGSEKQQNPNLMFLRTQGISYIHAFLMYVRKHGWETNETGDQIDELAELLKTHAVIKPRQFHNVSFRDIPRYYADLCRSRIYLFNRNYYKISTKRITKDTSKLCGDEVKMDEKTDTTDEILMRLKSLSAELDFHRHG